MTVLDRHVLREWLTIFFLMLVALLGMGVIVDLTRTLEDFRAHNASVADLLYYEFLIVPTLLPVVLPITVLMSLLYALGRMHRNHEFIAMRAAGLGVFRTLRGVWAAGLLLTAGAWYLNASLVPWATEEARATEEQIKREARQAKFGTDTAAVVPVVHFYNQRGGRMWFMNRYDTFTRIGHGVQVSVVDSSSRELRRLFAAEASYSSVRRGWVFRRGREYTFDPGTGEVQSPIRTFNEHFEPRFDEDVELMLLLKEKPNTLSLFEVQRLHAYLVGEKNPLAASYGLEIERKTSAPFGILVVMALAIPFAITGVRVNPAVGVAKSLGVFVAYYMLSMTGKTLAERGAMPVEVAAWLPHAIAIVVAVWAFRKIE